MDAEGGISQWNFKPTCLVIKFALYFRQIQPKALNKEESGGDDSSFDDFMASDSEGDCLSVNSLIFELSIHF